MLVAFSLCKCSANKCEMHWSDFWQMFFPKAWLGWNIASWSIFSACFGSSPTTTWETSGALSLHFTQRAAKWLPEATQRSCRDTPPLRRFLSPVRHDTLSQNQSGDSLSRREFISVLFFFSGKVPVFREWHSGERQNKKRKRQGDKRRARDRFPQYN